MKLIDKAPRGALYVFVALALGCMIAACGSSSSSTTSGSSGSSTSTTASAAAGGGGPNSTRRAALVACLKQHGVTLPSRPAGAPPGGAPGSGGSSGSGTGTGTGTTSRRGFFGGGGAFANNPKMQAAFKACGANFGFRGGGGRFAGRLSHTVITKYVACVRQHGYNLPTPNFSGKGSIFPANIRTNAKFQAASRACQSILVPPGGGGTGGGTSTNSGA